MWSKFKRNYCQILVADKTIIIKDEHGFTTVHSISHTFQAGLWWDVNCMKATDKHHFCDNRNGNPITRTLGNWTYHLSTRGMWALDADLTLIKRTVRQLGHSSRHLTRRSQTVATPEGGVLFSYETLYEKSPSILTSPLERSSSLKTIGFKIQKWCLWSFLKIIMMRFHRCRNVVSSCSLQLSLNASIITTMGNDSFLELT